MRELAQKVGGVGVEGHSLSSSEYEGDIHSVSSSGMFDRLSTHWLADYLTPLCECGCVAFHKVACSSLSLSLSLSLFSLSLFSLSLCLSLPLSISLVPGSEDAMQLF